MPRRIALELHWLHARGTGLSWLHARGTGLNLGLLVCAGISCLACADDVSDDLSDGEAQFRSLDDDLELHWTFEDRVGNQITDVSGNGRHGWLAPVG